MCSTPYGIYGFGTKLWKRTAPSKYSAQRLTASMVSALSLDRVYWFWVFVLNALRHLWFRHEILFKVIPGRANGAQRLTASMVSAHYAERNSTRGAKVLNALRHLWFRHRGVVEAYIKLANRGMCSTPYGIYGFGTPKPWGLGHLGNKCSTPYGIYGFGTLCAYIESLHWTCAQRLTASMVSAPRYAR